MSNNPLRIIYDSAGRSQLSKFDQTQGAQPPEPPVLANRLTGVSASAFKGVGTTSFCLEQYILL